MMLMEHWCFGNMGDLPLNPHVAQVGTCIVWPYDGPTGEVDATSTAEQERGAGNSWELGWELPGLMFFWSKEFGIFPEYHGISWGIKLIPERERPFHPTNMEYGAMMGYNNRDIILG
jgi:hypothetical protein